jgi:hypothetical protein
MRAAETKKLIDADMDVDIETDAPFLKVINHP